MLRALHVAATGMVAQQTRLDSIANNLANANTTGFKRQHAEFEDLVYQNVRTPGRTADGGMGPTGVQLGLGSRVVATARHWGQGSIVQTGKELDVAVEGSGLLPVLRPDGTVAYTRDGALKVDADGRIVTSAGLPLEPPISVPPDATAVTISPDGRVSAQRQGQQAPSELGQLQLATFPNPDGLQALGHNLFGSGAASGEALVGAPGTDGRGVLQQGALEGSNVEVVTEMIDMIGAQRAYEINSKVITAADEMLRNATNIR
ncbi:MAG: flagellar basal-body rod protein FlgG [Myxococcales bacterium]|nr:flagellar basal-body rod protein FlgG [Myxococcales bacterium]